MNMIARVDPQSIRLMRKLAVDGVIDQARREKGWTATRTQVALALFNSGLSAREVANEIGGVSRNGVIGKVHRSEAIDPQRKLPRGSNDKAKGQRQPPTRRTHERGALVRPKPPAREKPIPPNVVDAQIPESQRRTLDQLGNCVCHWPVGDPREPGFFFCGAPKVNDEDIPYCRSHQFRSRRHDVGRRVPAGAAFVNASPNAPWR